MVWTLDVRPSDITEVYWSHTLHDLKTMMRIRTEYELANSFQLFESLRLAINEALGGTEGGTPQQEKPLETYAELERAFAELGGMIGG